MCHECKKEFLPKLPMQIYCSKCRPGHFRNIQRHSRARRDRYPHKMIRTYALKKFGWDVLTIACNTKVSYALIKGWENNGYIPSNVTQVKKLCDGLGCKVSDIFPEPTIQMMKEFYGINLP